MSLKRLASLEGREAPIVMVFERERVAVVAAMVVAVTVVAFICCNPTVNNKLKERKRMSLISNLCVYLFRLWRLQS